MIAVGIGTPGFIDKETGTVVGGCENIPALQGRSPSERIARSFGVPSFTDNDATCAAAGELSFGAGRTLGSFVLMTLGTGIGGGLVLDGRVFRGSRGFAAEIGHLCVDPNGLWCNCGSRGCLEQYASGPGMVRLHAERLAKRRMPVPIPPYTPKDIVDMARAGDRLAMDTLEDSGRWISQAFGSILNILDLEACIVGGGISQAGEILLEPIRRHLPDFTWPIVREGVSILAAELKNDAGILGAAAQAIDRLEG